MNKDKLEKLLLDWSKQMVCKFDGLIIRFEYNESYHCYLVSYNRLQSKEQAKKFFKNLINFERALEKSYPHIAPLFSENNRLFKMSDKAKTISKESHS